MSSAINQLGSYLLYSSLLLFVVMLFIQVTRKLLIRLHYSRMVILKLWLAVPLSLLAYFVAMKWMGGQHYIEPMILSFPVSVQALSAEVSFYFDWKLVFLLIWMLIAGWKILHLLHQYLMTKSTILKHAELMHEDVYDSAYHSVYHSDLTRSPMAFGLFKPVIILPQTLLQRLTPAELQLVLLHESIHCRRADPLWRFAMACLHAMYWFLPGFGFCLEALIEDQEFACDEQVVSESQQLSVYAQLLLTLNVNQDQHPRRAFNETILCAASFNLKERIMKLNQIKNTKHQLSIISLFLMAVFIIGSASALPQVSGENAEGVELVVTHKVPPMYPFTAYKEMVSGQVTLSFTVTQEGKVTNVEVVESTPAEVFDKAAVKAMKQWTFEPIEKETQARQVIEFELDTEIE